MGSERAGGGKDLRPGVRPDPGAGNGAAKPEGRFSHPTTWPKREDLKPGQQIWVTMLPGEPVKRNDDTWARWSVAMMLTRAQPEKGGFSVDGAFLSEPLERTEAEAEFQLYAEVNILPGEGEW